MLYTRAIKLLAKGEMIKWKQHTVFPRLMRSNF